MKIQVQRIIYYYCVDKYNVYRSVGRGSTQSVYYITNMNLT